MPPSERDALASDAIDEASELLKPNLVEPARAAQLAAQLLSVVEVHSGPFPHPKVMQEYELAMPGSAREIVAMARAEQSYRHRIGLLEVFYSYAATTAGFIALLFCIGGAVFLAIHDKSEVASLLLGVPVIGVIGWFVESRLGRSSASSGQDKNPSG